MIEILTVDRVAEILLCNELTVADRLNRGVIPGLKFGRTWIIPAGALNQRLHDLSLEEAERRREEAQQEASHNPRTQTPQMTPTHQKQPRKRGRPRFVGSGVVV